MGVRIDSSASATKAAKSGPQAVGKRDGQPAGTETDFSQVLAQSRPKKPASDDAPAPDKSAPAVKATEKKPVKTKQKGDHAGDDAEASPAAQDAVASRTTVEAKGDEGHETSPVDDDADAVAKSDSDSDDQHKTDAKADANQVTAKIDPSQIAVAAAQPQPPQPQASTATVMDAQAQPPAPKPVKAAPSTATLVKPDPKANSTPPSQSIPATGNVKSTPADDKKDAKDPVTDDADAPKPVQTTAETGVAIQPLNQSGEHAANGEAGGAEVRSQQSKTNVSQATTPANSPAARFNELFQAAAADRIATDKDGKPTDKTASPTDVALTALANDASSPTKSVEAKPAQVPPPPVAPDVRFAEDNHPKVVTAVKTQLLPSGGTIQLRLDPPDLGPLRLEVRMEDGSMSASFVTASDQATNLLTHSLGQLKHALEGAGISVDKLQVRQGSAEHFAENSDQRQQQGGAGGDQSSARQEQQRREMLNRMWRKVAGGDPLDLVA